MSKIKNIGVLLVVLCFLLLPHLSLADYTIETNSATTPLYTIGTGEYTDLAQEITTTDAGNIVTVDVCLYTSGSPSGDVTIDIEGKSAGVPDGSSIGTGSLAASSLPVGSGAAARVTFTVTQTAVATTTDYFIHVSRDNTDGGVVLCGNDATPYVWTSNDNAASWTAGVHQGNISTFVFIDTPPEEVDTGTTTPQIFSTTTVLIDNPTQDFFNGVLLFLIGFFGMFYLFGKKR